MSAAQRKLMRILAWPAFRKQAVNPHFGLLYDRVRRLGIWVEDWTIIRALFLHRVDLWHLHFPDKVVSPRSTLKSTLSVALFCILLQLARWRGTRVLWTVHDLGSHDRLHPRLEAWFWRFFVPRVDAWICLSEGSRPLVQEYFPKLRHRPAFVCPRGGYSEAYPDTVSRDEARRVLDVPPGVTLLLHFGLIRPYKNVPHLVRTFSGLGRPDVRLLVAGRPIDKAIEREVWASVRGSEAVRLILGHIEAADVGTLFRAADLVVLPYGRILNSGAVRLAMRFACPVLVPDLGVLREQQTLFGSAWIHLYEGELTTDELAGAIQWAKTTPRPSVPPGDPFDWTRSAGRLAAIYRLVLEQNSEDSIMFSQRARGKRRLSHSR